MPALSGTISGNASTVQQRLPGNRYKHAVWHQLEHTQVTGDQLRCPRVRKGPDDSGDSDASNSDDEDDVEKMISRKKFKSLMEKWSKSEAVNFSYQDLGHAYQRKNFLRILKQLKVAKTVHLIDDSLEDLRAVSLSKCEMLNLRKNYFKSFANLPRCSRLRHLCLVENNVTSLDASSRFPNLESLDLSRNPIQFERNYRSRVFKAFPKLRLLDGKSGNEEELEVAALNSSSSVCVIS